MKKLKFLIIVIGRLIDQLKRLDASKLFVEALTRHISKNKGTGGGWGVLTLGFSQK